MRNNKWKLLVVLLLIIGIFTLLTTASAADFGDFGGDSDFGGDFDSGSDWGSDSDSSFFPVIFSGDGDGDFNWVTVVIIVIIIVVVLVIKNKSKNSSGNYTQNANKTYTTVKGATKTDVSALQPISTYKERDPGFDQTALSEKLSNLYVQMQNGWSARNIDSLRPYFTDTLWAQYDRQLEENYRKKHRTSHIERISVLGIDLKGWRTSGENDEIIASIRTRITVYVTDDYTSEIVQGSQTAEKFMEYEWIITRKSGVVTTSETGGTRTVNCPHCGAPVDINKSAKCEYCDSILTVDSVDWVINTIKGISQHTA